MSSINDIPSSNLPIKNIAMNMSLLIRYCPGSTNAALYQGLMQVIRDPRSMKVLNEARLKSPRNVFFTIEPLPNQNEMFKLYFVVQIWTIEVMWIHFCWVPPFLNLFWIRVADGHWKPDVIARSCDLDDKTSLRPFGDG